MVTFIPLVYVESPLVYFSAAVNSMFQFYPGLSYLLLLLCLWGAAKALAWLLEPVDNDQQRERPKLKDPMQSFSLSDSEEEEGEDEPAESGKKTSDKTKRRSKFEQGMLENPLDMFLGDTESRLRQRKNTSSSSTGPSNKDSTGHLKENIDSGAGVQGAGEEKRTDDNEYHAKQSKSPGEGTDEESESDEELASWSRMHNLMLNKFVEKRPEAKGILRAWPETEDGRRPPRTE